MRHARDWLLLPLVTVIAAGGIGWGGRSAYRAVRNRSPRPTTCAALIDDPDGTEWVQLSGCDASLNHIGIQTFHRRDAVPDRFDRPSAVFIPLRPTTGTGSSSEERITLLLAVDHGPLLAVGDELTKPDQDEIQRAFEAPLEGMIERRLDRSARDRAELRDLGMFLAEDFLVIDYGKRPRPLWLAFGTLAAGLAALAYLVRRWRRRTKPPTVAKATVVRE